MTSRIVLFIILLIILVIFVAPVVLTAAGVLSLPLRIVRLLIFLPILVAVAFFRNAVGEWDLAQLLTEQQSLSEKIPVIANDKTRSWGVEICRIMLKQTEIPESMRKAMIRESETKRIRRAVVKEAEGNRQAARTLAEEPSGLYLRYLQSLKDISSGKNTIVFLPLPGELLKSLTDAFKQATQSG